MYMCITNRDTFVNINMQFYTAILHCKICRSTSLPFAYIVAKFWEQVRKTF